MWIDNLSGNKEWVSLLQVNQMFDDLLLNPKNRESVILALDGLSGKARMQQMGAIINSSQQGRDDLKSSIV